MKHLDQHPRRAIAALCLASLLAACGGGGNSGELPEIEQPQFPTAESTPEKQASELFAAAIAGATTGTTPHAFADACTSDADCPDPVDAGGDVVGIDMVAAINDPRTITDGTALIRKAALEGEDDPAPVPPPNIPDPSPDDALTSGAGVASRMFAQGFTTGPKVVNPTGKKVQRVKLEVVTKSNAKFGCSGTLIDSQWIVTAAHCVFEFKDKAGQVVREYAKSVAVIPGYGDKSSLEPFGRAHSTKILIRNGYWQSGDFNFDVAWVKLDRPIGGYTGYHDYKRIDCSQFLSDNFTSHGYPADPAKHYPGFPNVNGKDMYELKFKFDVCKGGNNNKVSSGFMAIGGQSGSGAVLPASGGFGGTVAGVLSTGTDSAPLKTTFVRLSKNSVNNIAASISESTPSNADMAPVQVMLSTETTTPGVVPTFSVGQKVYLTSWFHNLGLKSFSGNLKYTAYLSANNSITTLDKPLKSFQVGGTAIASKETRADSHQIFVPCRPAGKSPSETIYIGVIVTNSDANVQNNDSSSFSAPVKISGAPCAQ
jgi:V8-like Glu-specific endopeptidase